MRTSRPVRRLAACLLCCCAACGRGSLAEGTDAGGCFSGACADAACASCTGALDSGSADAAPLAQPDAAAGTPDAAPGAPDTGGADVGGADAGAAPLDGGSPSPCAPTPAQFCALLTDSIDYSTAFASPPKPAEGTAYTDPVWGTTLRRIEQPQVCSASDCTSTNVKPYYSKKQSWNADGTRLLLRTGIRWQLYDARTYRWLAFLGNNGLYQAGYTEGWWDATDPDLLYAMKDLSLLKYRISTGALQTVHTFDCAGCTLVHTGGEGNPSEDARTFALWGEAGDIQIEAIVYDRQADAVIARKPVADLCGGACDSSMDWIGMSPSGNYVVVQWTSRYPLDADHVRGSGTELYSRDLTYLGLLSSTNYHGDVGYDVNGDEVWVSKWDFVTRDDYYHVKIRRLSDLSVSRVVLPPHSSQYHVSMRAMDGPARGWMLFSTYDVDGTAGHGWAANELLAIRIDARQPQSSEWRRIGRNFSIRGTDYEAEPHATPNRDFTRLVFGSNWLVPGGQVQAYAVELP